MLLDRAIDFCAEVLYEPTFRVELDRCALAPWEGLEDRERRGERWKQIVRTFFKEAIFIASTFLGAMYRFPFFVVEEDESDRVDFCFEVRIPLTFP